MAEMPKLQEQFFGRRFVCLATARETCLSRTAASVPSSLLLNTQYL